MGVVSCLLALLAAGCISGRVLNGYPGYPFVSFAVPQPADTAFFRLEEAVQDEGYPLDYTERASGFIKTRPAPDSRPPVFLSVVVSSRPGESDSADVWIGAFQVTSGEAAQRVNPLDEARWKDLVETSGRISERLGGTAPVGPAEPATKR